MTKFLIIRFSSIGDIIQCMGIIGGIRERFADVEIHWITRKDMVGTLSMDGRIDKIWAFDKETGLAGLLKMAADLRKEHFDYIYDAHSNIRSNILKLIVSPLPFVKPYVALRSKERGKRFLLFKLGINHFDKPFRGMVSFQKPLKKWGITHFADNYHDWHFPDEIRSKYENFVTKDMITLVPSANWEMKRWPVSYWKELVALLPEYKFVILAGPKDTFCDVNGRTKIDVTMVSDAEALDEVVVTAMGIKRESKTLTYSAQTVGGKDLNEIKNVNMINSLQGKSAGLQITPNSTGAGGSSKILFRGNKSISGNNQPLIVVDGVPMMMNVSDSQIDGSYGGGRDGGDAMSTINPDDIAQITLLKGASAAALYVPHPPIPSNAHPYGFL